MLLTLLRSLSRTICKTAHLYQKASYTNTRARRAIMTLSDFLLKSKTDYLNDIKNGSGREWTVVMGNEAGGKYIAKYSVIKIKVK